MNKFLSVAALSLLMGFSSKLLATSIVVGEKLPELQLVDKGECVLDGDKTDYVDWQASKLTGRIQVLEYVAARQGIDKINANFYAAVKQLPNTELLQVTKIVNSDDALWGTSGLVAGEIEKNKRQEPGTRFVIDAEGKGLDAWQLKKKSAALMLLDAEGRVLLVKEGGLSADELETAKSLIIENLSASHIETNISETSSQETTSPEDTMVPQ